MLGKLEAMPGLLDIRTPQRAWGEPLFTTASIWWVGGVECFWEKSALRGVAAAKHKFSEELCNMGWADLIFKCKSKH
jgi:hypothetical protein